MKKKEKILEAVVDENNGEKVVICHCGAISTEHMKSLASHTNKAGASAVSSISPFYYKFNTDEIIEYYIDLVDAAKLPVIVYNFPEQSGFTITLDILARMLKERPGIIGIKHISYDLYQFERIKTKYPNVMVFNGHDEVYLSSPHPKEIISSIENIMQECACIVREEKKLKEAIDKIEDMECQYNPYHYINEKGFIKEALSAYNSLITSKIVLSAMLYRKESRGSHYRVGFPNKYNEKYGKMNYVTLSEDNNILIRSE